MSLDTAFRIKDGDAESWYGQWNRTAARLESTAEEFVASGHKISAKEAFMRASNYYRNAGFYLEIIPTIRGLCPPGRRAMTAS